MKEELTLYVSGTVALMLEANPWLTPDQAKSLLEATATPMPEFGEHEVGAGFLNAYEAVRTALALLVTARGHRSSGELHPQLISAKKTLSSVSSLCHRHGGEK